MLTLTHDSPASNPRSRPRYEAYLEATIETGCISSAGTVLTISEAGLFVATPLSLAPGTRLTLSFQVPDQSSVRIPGLVIYHAAHHERMGLGVRFLTSGARGGVEAIRRWYEAYSIPV